MTTQAKGGSASPLSGVGAEAQPIDAAMPAELDALLDEGMYLRLVPQLARWQVSDQVDDRVRAVRLMRALGADRAGDALLLRTWRQHRQHGGLLARVHRLYLVNRGCFVWWQQSKRLPLPPTATPQEHAMALSAQGMALADLRDFDAALACHAQALSLDPDDPWLAIGQGYSLNVADRVDEAEAVLRGVLLRYPRHASAAERLASLLLARGQRDAARELMQQCLAANESSAPAWTLSAMLAEDDQHEQALLLLDEIERRQPMADRWVKGALAARRADAYLRLGRDAEAATHAQLAGQLPNWGYYERLAQRLAAASPGGDGATRRRVLQLEYVRQHQMTCAPATLATVCRYWGMEAEHLEIAQAICYDGTMAVSERLWAEQQGLAVREFSLTWDSACALIDAELPFTLTTVHTASGHLQALVGYDRIRRSLLVRDPMQPFHAEFDADALFESQRSNGPRAMLLLPPDQLHRLEGIELPESAAWDALYAVAAPLERHDHGAAQLALQSMRSQHPESWLTRRAERLLAGYDGNEPAILAATDALLVRAPDDVNLQLSRYHSITQLQGQAAAEQELAQRVSSAHPDPLLLLRWAERLALDGRRLPQAFDVLRRALRRTPTQARLWMQWAGQEWQLGHWQAALQPYRWAATLQPTDESAARAYACACHWAGQAEQGLQHLRQREVQWGDRSSSPAMTLVERLDELHLHDQANEALAAAIARRPQDAALQLFIAERHLHQQRPDDAAKCLEAISGPQRNAALLRVRALWLEATQQIESAHQAASQAALAEPFNLAHHRMVLRLLSRLNGRQRALALWSPAATAHPEHYGLQRLRYDWLGDDLAAIGAQLDLMHQHHPDDPWLARERALHAGRCQRHEEAVQLAQSALALAPKRVESHGVLAICLYRKNGYAAAVPTLKEASCLDVDYESALELLLCRAPDPAAAREACDHIAEQLQRQVLTGDGLLLFQTEARRGWTGQEILTLLQVLHDQHPSLWHTHVALARQLRELGQADAALEVLAHACERFAHLPRVHWEHALALRASERRAEALLANGKALALSPGWNAAVRLQVELIQETDQDWDAAQALISEALQFAWEDDDLMALLAWVHERQGGDKGSRDADVWRQAKRSLMLNPRPDWVWALLRRACARAQDWLPLTRLIDEVAQSRPGDAWAWLVQAEQGRDDEAALQAAERALALEPRLEAAWEARFQRLARLGRHDEIEQHLTALPWPDPRPIALRAWGPRCTWASGRRDAAIAQQRALLDDAPHDAVLLRTLADWLDGLDRHEAYREVATRFLAAAPLAAQAHAYMGHALVKLRHFSEAVPHLQQALALDPAYGFAAFHLCEAASRSAQPELAERALQARWPLEPSIFTACQGVMVAVQARQEELAFAWLERLLGCDGDDIERCEAALNAVRAQGWGERLEPLLRAQASRGTGPVGTLLAWLGHGEGRSFWLTWWRAKKLLPGTEGMQLHLALVRWLTDTHSPNCLRWLTRQHGPRLHADPTGWGLVGYAWLSLDRHSTVLTWMHDWRTRADAPAWTMANLTAAQAHLRRWEELAQAVQLGLLRDPNQSNLRAWQLVVRAWQNDHKGLQHGLARVHEWEVEAWSAPIVDMLRAYAELVTARGGDRTWPQFRSFANRSAGSAVAMKVYRMLSAKARWEHTSLPNLWRWLM